MLVLRITFTFEVPVLDGSNNVAFICGTELNLNFISFECLWILKKEVESARMWLDSLFILHNEISQTEK